VKRARSALDELGLDVLGLDARDRAILDAMITKFAGGPVGLDTLATAVSEDRATLEEVYEPFLIEKGFVQRTSRGRVATERAYGHLGYAYSRAGERGLEALALRQPAPA
jgi:Holliday junction DNA helicase RuvB